MIDVKVSIRRIGSASPAIQMSMGEYVDFIRGQTELLNIEKCEKPLTRSLERTHPGLRHPGPYPTSPTYNPEIKEVRVSLDFGEPGGDSSAKYTAEELGKRISKAMDISNKAYKEENKC